MAEEIILSDVEAEEVQDRLLLSTVQKIKKLSPIPGKDRVEKVEFESIGFTAIVEKGLHKEGDLVVFTKYDSVVADKAPFDWMKDFKFRVKPKSFTIKDEEDTVTGKIYSQGIVVKLKAVEDFLATTELADEHLKYPLLEGDDLTLALGTKKYLPPVKGNGMGNMQSKGDFPTHLISKTDELNLASKVKLLEQFKGLKCVARMKMEGSSLTVYTNPDDLSIEVCSRNNRLKEEEGNKFWRAVNNNGLKEKLQSDPVVWKSTVIQAELMGPGVQKNKLNLPDMDMYIFTASDIGSKHRVSDEDLCWVADTLGLKIAPLVGEWEEFDLTFDQLQEIADNLEYLPGVPAEGLVLRPVVPIWSDKMQDWLSIKVINRNYTL